MVEPSGAAESSGAARSLGAAAESPGVVVAEPPSATTGTTGSGAIAPSEPFTEVRGRARDAGGGRRSPWRCGRAAVGDMPRTDTAVKRGADTLPLALRLCRRHTGLRGGALAVTLAGAGVGESAFGAAFGGAIGGGSVGGVRGVGARGVGVGGCGKRLAAVGEVTVVGAGEGVLGGASQGLRAGQGLGRILDAHAVAWAGGTGSGTGGANGVGGGGKRVANGNGGGVARGEGCGGSGGDNRRAASDARGTSGDISPCGGSDGWGERLVCVAGVGEGTEGRWKAGSGVGLEVLMVADDGPGASKRDGTQLDGERVRGSDDGSGGEDGAIDVGEEVEGHGRAGQDDGSEGEDCDIGVGEEAGGRGGAGNGVESGIVVVAVVVSGANGGREDRTRLDGESAYGGDEEDGSDGGGGDGHGKMLADSHGFCGRMGQVGYGTCDGTVAAIGSARRGRLQR